MTKDSKGARGRRFATKLAPQAAQMNASIDFDYRLLAHDVKGSIAHARMLAKQGILSKREAEAIEKGLHAVAAELVADPSLLDDDLEDIHMNVEARLSQKYGKVGQRLHTARSRNDQVATDLRLYAMEACEHQLALLRSLRFAIVHKASQHVADVMPGYTHLQRAQPITIAHHLLAYDAMFSRDAQRIRDAMRRVAVSPLGSGALAATTIAIDREFVAKDLGFVGVSTNSMDAVSDRDFAVELVGAFAIAQMHLSRLGEEIVLWMSHEFGFATLPEEYCSGSSLMAQKVNPDLAELIRAKTGRMIGDWVTLMTVLKGLPLAYNKDLQETQEPLYDATQTLQSSLEVAAGMMQSLQFHPAVLKEATENGYLNATELVDFLVDKGMPFREAHDIAGAIVRLAIRKNKKLSELDLHEYRKESELFNESIYQWLDIQTAVNKRDVIGGPSQARVASQIEKILKELEQEDQNEDV